MKKWEIIADLGIKNKKFKTEEVVEILLKNRGIKTKTEKEAFLNPKLSEISSKTVMVDRAQLNKTIKIPIFKGLGRGIAATIIMSALAYFMTRIGIPIIPTLLVSVISYPLLLILFREPLLKSVPIINRFAK